MDKAAAQQRYYDRSARECGCCDCCSLHCCSLCIMICWIIGGIFSFYSSYTVVSWVEDGSYYTGEPCYTSTGTEYDACCYGEEDFYGTSGTVTIYGVTCEEVETVYTIQMVSAVLQCIASVLGIIGICAFIVVLMLAPLIYSLVVVGVSIYFMFFFENYLTYPVDIALSLLVVYLFYRNWKIASSAQNGEL